MNYKIALSIAICLVAIATGYFFYKQPTVTAKKQIYFFSASWCPTCQEADCAFRANPESLPSDVALLTIDYDREVALKEKHNVTSPHTFIVFNEEGQEIARYSGDEIKQQGWVVPSV